MLTLDENKVNKSDILSHVHSIRDPNTLSTTLTFRVCIFFYSFIFETFFPVTILPSTPCTQQVNVQQYRTRVKRHVTSRKQVRVRFTLQNKECGYSLKPPRRGGSKRVPTINVLCTNIKSIDSFPMKFSILQPKKYRFIGY